MGDPWKWMTNYILAVFNMFCAEGFNAYQQYAPEEYDDTGIG